MNLIARLLDWLGIVIDDLDLEPEDPLATPLTPASNTPQGWG